MNISQSSTGKLIYDRKVANLIEKSQFEGVEGIVALFFFYKYISLVFPVLFPEECVQEWCECRVHVFCL